MSNMRSSLGRKAAKATVRHSVRGFSAKAQRKPLRSITLLTLGGLVGGLIGATAGWVAGRNTGKRSDPRDHTAADDPLAQLERLEHAQPAE